jgi:hypothetical protein
MLVCLSIVKETKSVFNTFNNHKMKHKILLRSASIIILIHNLGHTFGALTWKHADDPAKQKIIDQMIEYKFPFMGASRSMGEYYDGYGFVSTLALLFIAAILWVLSGVSLENKFVKKTLVITSVTMFFLGITELIFFFPLAAAFSLLAFVLTIFALLKQKIS